MRPGLEPLETFSKRISIGTDVAMVAVFHPKDLEHTTGWPLGWLEDPFAWAAESGAGRIAAWGTTADGGWHVRFTDGPLTERERQYAGPSWAFPLTVRHGRLLLDNLDALPGESGRNPSEEDLRESWVEVPNGDWILTVTAVEWDAEPGADPEKGNTLPNYIAQFTPAGDARPAIARRPPDLPGDRSRAASDEPWARGMQEPTPIDITKVYPAFVAAKVARPGARFETQGEAPIETALKPGARNWDLFDLHFVACAELAVGAPCVMISCHQSGSAPGEASTYGFWALRMARIAAFDDFVRNGETATLVKSTFFGRKRMDVPSDALAGVRLEPWPGAADGPPYDGVAALRQQLLADLRGQGPLAKPFGGRASYEALHVEWMDDKALANWLMDNLPLSARAQLALAVLPPNAQLAAAAAHYDAMPRG
jgi:hypothetical protein